MRVGLSGCRADPMAVRINDALAKTPALKKHNVNDMNLLSACRKTARRTFRIQIVDTDESNCRPEFLQEASVSPASGHRSLGTGLGRRHHC
jgi:hypothetical protein